MQLMTEWKQYSILLDCKPIIWQFLSWYICCPLFVIAMEMSDISTDVGIPHQTVKTLLMNIPISLAKWNIAITFICILAVLLLLTPLQASFSLENTAPQLTFPKKGPTSFKTFRSSSLTRLECIWLLYKSQHLLDLVKLTTSAFSMSHPLFSTLTRPFDAHYLIYNC